MLFFLLPKKVADKIRTHQPFYLLFQFAFGTVVLYWLAVTVIMAIEPYSFTNANWLIWQTFLTIGYGDKTPQTNGGMWFVMASGFLGVALMSAIIGAGVAAISYILELKKGGLMQNPHSNGYAILGFPGEGNMIEMVKQLRFTEPNVPVVIVDNKLDELPNSLRLLPKVHFVRGSMVRPEVYSMAALEKQKAIAVHPLDRNDPNSDAATASAVRMIMVYLEQHRSAARIEHMLVDPDNAPMFVGLESQEISKRADILMLVQEFQGAGSAQVLEQLLRNDVGDNPQTYPAKAIVGMCWEKLRRHVFELYANDEMSFSLLALIRGKNPPNTRPDRNEVVREGDVICVLAGNDFDWDRAETLLAQRERREDLPPKLGMSRAAR